LEFAGTLMEHDKPIVEFKISKGELVYKKEFTENADAYLDLWTPGEITGEQLQSFFTYRIPAWHRPSVQRACKKSCIIPGDVEGFIKKTHGVWGDDHFWVRFQGDDALRWDDVKLRD
jgi:hypothetical protein